MKSIKSIQNLKNKKILVRVDFNVPISSGGVIDSKEDWRIKAALPTIEYLLEKKAKIILMSHLGRPEANYESRITNQEYSLKPVADKLGELLNREIKFVDDCVGEKVRKTVEEMQTGEIVLLENLRFYKGEKNNNKGFAKRLADLADVYVNDAFSVSHRRHASVCAITKFLPSYAGLLLEKEVKVLSEAMNNPDRPAIAIIGGAKVKTKFPVIEYLIGKFNYILVGGMVANEILDDEVKEHISKIPPAPFYKGGIKTIPFNKGGNFSEGNKSSLKNPPNPLLQRGNKNNPLLQRGKFQGINNIKLPSDSIWENGERFDIGPETIKEYLKIISEAKTIIWNGPMGMFEKDKFSGGTKNIAAALTKSKGYVIIGGGETIAAMNEFGDLEKINYVSTGGGAMLEFLAGERLAGLEVLK